MIGAILGDIIGSPYEFDCGNKSKDFPLFSRKSTYTDDTVMTLAVGLTILDAQPSASDDWILRILANRMRQFGKMYPNAGYGGMFRQWLRNPECQAYNSFGNGSTMLLSCKLDAPDPCRLDAPDFGFVCHVLADCLHQHRQAV